MKGKNQVFSFKVSNNMNGLILVPNLFSIGGIQKFNLSILDALQSEFPRSKFRALSLLDSKDEATKAWDNVTLLYCGRLPWKKIAYVLRAIKSAITMRPNIIICGHVNIALLGFIISKLLGCKFIIIAHGIDVWYLKKGLRFHALHKANLVVAVSRYTRRILIENGVSSNKIVVINNCVNTKDFYPTEKDRELLNRLNLSNKKVILTVGRVLDGKHKGHKKILDALSRMSEEYVWLLVGAGEGISYLRERAEYLKILNKIRFCTSVAFSELTKYYNLCDVFVLLSDCEGFGIVFLEAMACGKPVIASNRGGSCEPLLDGKLGFLVDTENQEQIISLIGLVSEVREERTSPEFLRNNVEDNFGVAVFKKKINEVLTIFCKDAIVLYGKFS